MAEGILLYFLSWLNLSAQDAEGSRGGAELNRREHLEFTHPLITESITPDSKIRLTFLDTKSSENLLSRTYDLELEYAPVNFFSIHLDVPYVVLDPPGSHNITNLDETELDFKFANYALSAHGIILGYGLSFGLPTGNQSRGIGSDHIFNFYPFLNGGIIWKKWEWTAFFIFSIPSNQREGENIQSGLETRLTSIYHITARWAALVEAGDATRLSHFSSGGNSYDITGGIIFRPHPEKPWIIGAGVRSPVFENNEIKFQAIFSVFYHFSD
jgi:hypothetical protein